MIAQIFIVQILIRVYYGAKICINNTQIQEAESWAINSSYICPKR